MSIGDAVQAVVNLMTATGLINYVGLSVIFGLAAWFIGRSLKSGR